MVRSTSVLILFIVAAVTFSLLFLGIVFHFWLQMAITVATLCLLAHLSVPNAAGRLLKSPPQGWIHAVAVGLLSATFLYFVFYVGNVAVRRLFERGARDIAAVYNLKCGTSSWLIALLITFVIGPGEEIFWRGYLQTGLEQRYGRLGLVLAPVAYASVHVASGNPVLILAATICGVFWVLLFRYFRSMWLNIISHVAWDLAVFLIFPLSTNIA